MNTNFEQVRQIFLTIVERPPEQWESRLDEACGTDPELRQQVGLLLKAHADEGGILDQNAAPQTQTGVYASLSEGPGTQIGPYKLMEQIGEGGMGLVFVAEQHEPVRRKVALKVIKPGMDTRDIIARFEAERQALALMDHPNIARVLDAGATASGRPYFVMELVKGSPITQFCDDNRLTTRERLELFTYVCHAVQHAHQKGIIHRDIKPTNVLVTSHDGRPAVKVIDFGVAKAIGQQLTVRTIYTALSQMVGTPLYMSPEQAGMSGLDIDTRTDVYSLGVLLYELLTGATPFDKDRLKQAAYDEMRRIIREEEPPKPSTRISSSDAAPSVSACRHTEPAKLAKLVRGELDWIVMKALEKDRNRRYETANGFAMDVQRYLADERVQACPPSVMYGFRKFARRNKAALVMASVIGVALLLAVGSLGWVVRDRAAGRVRTAGEVNQFLQQAESLYADNKLPEAVAEIQKARGVLEAGSGDEDLRRRVGQWLTDLDTAAKLEEIRLESSSETDRGQAYAQVFRDYGIDVEALPIEESTARVAASQIKIDLALAVGAWGSRLRFDPRLQDPARWQRLLAISRAAHPDPWRLRLLGAAEAKDVQALRDLASEADPGRLNTRTLAYLGDSLRTAGDVEAAVAFLRKAQRQHPDDFAINGNLAVCLSELQPPPWDEAVAFQRAALAVRPRNSNAHSNLGMMLKAQGKLDEAIAAHKKAIELDPKHANAYNNFGNALSQQKKLDEAVEAYNKAIEIDPKHAPPYYNLGNALRVQGKLDDAITSFRKAIDLDPRNASAHINLGSTLRDQKKLEEAIACYRKAIEIDPKSVMAYNNLGIALHQQKKPDEAIAACRKAIDLDPKCAAAYNNLGRALRDQQKLDEAMAAYHAAIEIDPEFASAYVNLGNAFRDQKKWDEALAAYGKAIDLDPKLGFAYSLGVLLAADKKWDESIAWFEKAIEISPKEAKAHYYLGVALQNLKKPEEAIAAYRKSIELDSESANAYIGLGNTLYEQQKLDDAIVAYTKGIELDPKAAAAYRSLGNALRGQKKLDEAVAAYRKAIELDPSISGAHGNLANTLRDLKKPEEAIAAYRKAIELDPKNTQLHYHLGVALETQRELDEAIAAYREAIELDPKQAPAYERLGFALAKKKDFEGAIAAYGIAVELNPRSAWVHSSLGDALSSQGKLDDAIAALRQAVSLEKSTAAASPRVKTYQIRLAHVLNARAWQLATAGDPKSLDPGRAIDLAQEVNALIPNWSASARTLGVAHYRARNWKAAAEALEESRSHYPKDSVTLFFLSMAHGRLNEKEQARMFYDQAAQWRMGIGMTDEELRRLCAEAAALLGLAVPPALTEPPALTPGPTLLNPSTGATLENGALDGSKLRVWEFDWSDVPGATQYHLYVTGATANHWVFDNSTLTSSSYRLESKRYEAGWDLGHRWKVRALVDDLWTDWSEERTFDVTPLVGKPAASEN